MLNWKSFHGKKICVAVSGGADSVALLHYLKAREAEYGYLLSAVHCEHGIRGAESLADMAFVQALCQKWGITLYTFSDNCPLRAEREKTSLETAARNFRYECFLRLVQENKTELIATAHHQNDEAETVLFRLARGASLTGMSAMNEQNGYLLRPFLGWSKTDILRYVQENGLEYREDKTNYETDATRNKIRWEILPRLEETVNGATENIARFAYLAAEDDALLYEWSARLISATVFEGQEVLQVAFCDKKPLFTRACLSVMKKLRIERDYTAAHLSALYALQGAERGARLCLPKGVRAEKTENGIVFYVPKPEESVRLGKEIPFTEKGFDGGRYEVNVSRTAPNATENEWKILRIDEDKLPKTAVFRFRREHDEIKCFGGGRKSLKKFLNEKKISPKERGYLPLIAERDGAEVYAICGVEISEKVKVDNSTKNEIYIDIRKKENGL